MLDNTRRAITNRKTDIKKELKRVSKYILVGGIGNGVHYLTLFLFTSVGNVHYLISAIIAIVLAATTNYLVNHYWSFKDVQSGNRNKKAGWVKFVSAKAVGDLGYLGLLALMTDVVGLHYMMSAAIANAITFVPGYVLVAWWVWGKKVWVLRSEQPQTSS